MKYLMLAYTGAKEWDESTVSEEEIARICRAYDDFERRLKANGEWLAAEGLADHSQTVTVAPSAKGAVVTDGPYIEAKEAMVSYGSSTSTARSGPARSPASSSSSPARSASCVR